MPASRRIIDFIPAKRPRVRLLPLFALGLALFSSPHAAGGPLTVSTSVGWNTNASNSDRSADEIGALQLDADVDLFVHRFLLGHDDALVLSGDFAAEDWPRFDGLNHLSGGPRLAWEHKFGLGALAPVLSLELAGDAIGAQDSERSAYAGSARLVWQQRFDESTLFRVSYARLRRNADDELYNQTADEVMLEVSRDLDERWSLAFTVRWRQGDVLSYTPTRRPDILALARDNDEVDTFGAPQIAYALKACTLSGALACTRTLDEYTALTFSYEGSVTERNPLRYVNHLISVSVSRQL